MTSAICGVRDVISEIASVWSKKADKNEDFGGNPPSR